MTVFRWWASIEVLGLAALPLTAWLFRRMPDRGYSLTKPAGILLAAYGSWNLAMIAHVGLSPGLIGWVTVAVAVLGFLLLGRGGLSQLLTDLRARVAWIVFLELAFAAILVLGLVIRFHSITGMGASICCSESPTDFAMLNGAQLSQSYPPQDPWLAQYAINYYYLGWVMIAVIGTIAGAAPPISYGLGVVTIMALAAVEIAGIVRNLIEVAQPTKPRRIWDKTGRWLFPAIGIVMVLLAGNQVGPLQLLAGSPKVIALNARQLAHAVLNGIGPRVTLQLPPPFPAGQFADNDPRLVPKDAVQHFDPWSSRLAVWDDLHTAAGVVYRDPVITEFPAFSFFLGDLHPVLLVLPWSLLALALAFNLALRARPPNLRRPGEILELAASGLVLGSLWAIHTWDFPTYLLLYLGMLLLVNSRASRTLPRSMPGFASQAVVVGSAAYLSFLLYHLTYHVPAQGSLLLRAPARTNVVPFFIVFGLFFIPLVLFLGQRLANTLRLRAAADLWLAVGIVLALLAALVVSVAAHWPLFALLPLAICASALAYRLREDTPAAFTLWAFAVGLLAVWAVDIFVFAEPHFSCPASYQCTFPGPRLNTIFKVYDQVWVIWGVLATFALWRLSREIHWRSLSWVIPVLVLFAGAMVFPLLSYTPSSFVPTLDGVRFLQRTDPEEAAAIAWVTNNTSTGDVVLEAPGISWRSDTSVLSWAAGRPTVVGWPRHELDFHFGEPGMQNEIERRVADVTTIYLTDDPTIARRLLHEYHVKYVFIGPSERQLLSASGAGPGATAKFARLGHRVLSSGASAIYTVDG